ncbi:splicing regulatory glutamine/lysine-rich protein [Acrasis kona]|uniref:Splicing regulatory glutamine/lysine-rich protein n=1 Tax=Acrasis kona TaxID=1008807 RepID=A0AAW2ZJT0_9EUKA
MSQEVSQIPASFSNLTSSQILRSIFVSRLAPTLNVKQVIDLFCYCGDIERVLIAIDPTNPNKQVSLVIFDDQYAYATSLLLKGLIIGESAVQVYPFHELVGTLPVPLKQPNNYPSAIYRSAQAVIVRLFEENQFHQKVDRDQLLDIAYRMDSTEQGNVVDRVSIAFLFCTGKIRPIESEMPEITGALNTVKGSLNSAGETLSKGWGYLKQQIQDAGNDSQPRGSVKIRSSEGSGYQQY